MEEDQILMQRLAESMISRIDQSQVLNSKALSKDTKILKIKDIQNQLKNIINPK